MCAWFICIILFHMASLRTIHTRVGYNKETFYPKDGISLAFSYVFLLPFVFCDSPTLIGFVLYLAKAWHRYWIVLMFVKIGILASMYLLLSFYIENEDNKEMRAVGHTYFGVSMTLLMVLIFPWVWKITTFVFYIIPWCLYTIGWLLAYPFEKC
jgi:hypothetical protein